MAIRIMHVVDQLGRGGLENGLVNLIHGLDPERFEHVVYAIRGLGPNADRLIKNGVRVICQGKQETDSRFQLPVLARQIRALEPDVVHSRNWGTVEAVMAARLVGRASVHGEHGLEATVDAKEPRRRTWIRRLAYEAAHQVLSVSHQLKDLHARRTGFAAGRITVIHNGVDPARYFPDARTRSRLRADLGVADDEFLIGCVGNLLPVKDHMTVLQALECLPANTGRWRLVIVGEGSERPALEAFLSGRPALAQRVTLLGASSRVPELLNALDVYVLPSLAEGICNSLLEAMSTGLPVIATETGGNPEVVVHGESGCLFPVGDFRQLAEQLLLFQGNQGLRYRFAEGAVRRVREEFSMESMIRGYAQVYETLGRRAMTTAVNVAARV
jgi:sugar transferase (PEP-CTERM/EpsH1 system associated)